MREIEGGKKVISHFEGQKRVIFSRIVNVREKLLLVERRDLIKETFNHRFVYTLNSSAFILLILNKLTCVSDSKQAKEN